MFHMIKMLHTASSVRNLKAINLYRCTDLQTKTAFYPVSNSNLKSSI